MDVATMFNEVVQEYDSFKELLVQAIALTEDEHEVEFLIGLAATLDLSMSTLKDEVPEALAHYQQTIQEMKQELDEIKQEAEQAVQEAEKAEAEMEAAPPAPPAPEGDWDQPIADTHLQRYRTELLALLAGTPKDAGKKDAGQDSREIWQDWSRLGE